MVDLGAYDEPVPFDDATADALKSAATTLSGTLETQGTSRSGWASTALAEFRGHYADVFESNAKAASTDCTNIASALDDLAAEVEALKEAAAAERERRRKAKEWADKQEKEWAIKSWWDDRVGTDKPPVGAEHIPLPEPHEPVTTSWTEPAPGAAGGTSSARPEDLRTYSSNVSGANDTVAAQKGTLEGAITDFADKCSWCSINTSGITTALASFETNNTNETRWVDTVAAAFEDAGGSGDVSTLSDVTLAECLAAAGVAESRRPLDVQAPSILGDPQTSGYADDPVNTTTGNFIEPETDLSFSGGAGSLVFSRMYNSLSQSVGVFGPGWASSADEHLVVGDEGATWVQASGRHVVFPRLAGGWDRADGDSFWLTAVTDTGTAADIVAAGGDTAAGAGATAASTTGTTGAGGIEAAGGDAAGGVLGAGGDGFPAATTAGAGGGFVVSDNAGGRWCFDHAGRPVWTSRGAGTRVGYEWSGGRLVGLWHEWGRSITVEWGPGGDRVTALVSSDGRRVDYAYDGSGRLTGAISDGVVGRSYVWNEQGLIAKVVDADGVVEADNTYNQLGQVITQRSAFGRVSHYSYLPGNVTQVADADGGRANTWVHDRKGRLVGMIDTDGHRQNIGWDRWGNRVQVTGRDGRTTICRYDGRGRLVTRVEETGARSDYEYDDADRVVRVSVTTGDDQGGPAGATGDGADGQSRPAIITYEYQGSDRNPSTVTDPEGGVTRLSWNQNLLTQVADPTGVRIGFGYDEHGDLVSVMNAEGDMARLVRDGAGRVIGAVDPCGSETEFRYDERGQLVSRRDPDGATWRFEYSAAGRLVARVDPAGARTAVELGPAGQETAGIDPLGRRLEQEWDDLGNLAGVRLPDGRQWSYVHDGLSRLTEVVSPEGAVWRTDYDVVGRATAMTDPTGVQQQLAWGSDGALTVSDASGAERLDVDALGRPVSVSSVPAPGAAESEDTDARVVVRDLCGRVVEALNSDGGLTKLVRDAAGRVVEEVSPAGRSTCYEWDRCGRLSAVTAPDGSRTVMTYDAASRLIAQDGPTGPVRIAYDACGRVTWMSSPGRGNATWDYDRVGRVRSIRSTAWGLVRFAYDEAGQLTSVTNALGGVTRYAYDECGRLVQVTDPLGNVTRRTYTATDKVETLVDPLGRTTRAGYDAAGRQLWQSDDTGERLAWVWDAAGRVERIAAGKKGLPDETCYELTEQTRHGLRVTGPGGTLDELAFDRLGRLTRHVRDGRTLGEWSWDADGVCTGFTGPDGQRTSYTYDDAGALVHVEGTAFGPVAVRHDEAGRLVGMDGPGLSQNWERDETGRVVTQSCTENGITTSRRISRDEAGRVIAVNGPEGTVRYSYDPAGQLTGVSGPDGEQSFTWDRAGHLTSRTVRKGSGEPEVTTFTYDAAGQLVSTDGPDGQTRFTYDAAGRRTSQDGPSGQWSYSWAPSGHLSAVTRQTPHGGSTWRINRDGLGLPKRIGGVDLTWDLSGPMPSLTGFGENTVAGLLGATAVNDTLVSSSYRPVRPAANEGDPWASPAPITQTNGVWLGAGGALGVDGLELLGARVYDPASSSFLSPDPLEQSPLAPWAANPYSYAANDPLAFSDPAGLKPLSDADLEAYQDDHGGLIGWAKKNKDYLIGGAMVLAGGILMATGVGGPLGGMLIGAGADTIIQRAMTGQVDYGQVAVSGLLGATGLRTAITTGATSGAAAGAGGSGYGYLTGPGPHTVGGFLTNTAIGGLEGGVLGGAGGAAGHGLATAGKNILGHLKPTVDLPEGIVYQREDLNGYLKPYVGQAKSPARYTTRQIEHKHAHPNSSFNFTRLEDTIEPGIQLDRYEEYWIRQLGGPTNKSNPDGGLSNKRHQMSEERYQNAGGDPYGP